MRQRTSWRVAVTLLALAWPRPAEASPIPSCAWKRKLGDIPSNTVSCSPNRGVALGGFGAGSFMYNLSGSFGPWELKPCDVRYESFWKALPQAAFHYYEKGAGDARPRVRCLSTDADLKPAWDKLKAGQATYCALQPKGWVVYDAFRSKPCVTFFSPIIAHNYRETSYPVAVFDYELFNPTKEPLTVAVMLTWPQAPYSTAPRKGFRCMPRERDDGAAVVLKAVDPGNPAETQNSEWCIAVGQPKDGGIVSHALSWDGDGDGGDIWADFADDGELGNKALDESMSAAAVAFKTTLKPGERRRVPFVISWDFPVVEFSSGTQWWRKYTEYFSRDAGNSFLIAGEALENHARWERQVDAWMNPFVTNPRYPDWLKCAAFNELYYNQFGGVFYEAGLKAGPEREFMGLHEDDHKHFVMESPIYRSANTLDVRHYSSIVFARFWPEIERDTLRCYGDGALHFQFPKPVPPGLVPHDVGDPTKCDPYFVFDVYRHDKPDLQYWKDLNPKYLQQVWRYYYLYRDKDFLDYAWPACKAAYEFMKTTDTDGDKLPNNFKSDNTYDDWGLFGTSLLCGGLWVGGLQAMEKMAEVEGDPIVAEVREWLAAAKANLDRQLWYEKGGYYRIDTESEHPTAIMADGLNGQRYSEVWGLGDILPPERMKAHLRKVYETCVKPMRDYTGDGLGDIGAINGVKEDGSLLGALQSDEVWTGSSYFLASLMYRAGLKREALQTAWGVYYITYVEPSTAFWFNTPESWRVPTMQPRPSRPEQYQRPRAVWELVFEIDDPLRRESATDERVENVLRKMTLEEKVALLSGSDDFSTRAIERLGIPSVRMTDGPHGVRMGKATCFPTATLLASSWNPGLVERVGQALGRETRAKGCGMLLGPCVNIHRSPLGGRNFESFSEDPHLAARMAVAYVKGVQSQGIATSTKHFACNNEEADRFFVDTLVDERALREIYLPAFKAAVQEGDTWTVMAAHNKINGPYCSAHPELLTDILKKEWGFEGFVVSDWWGVHDTVHSANAGMDLEMPGPGIYFGKPLLEAVRGGQVSEETVDDKVRRVLRVVFRATQGGASALDTPEHRALAREAAADGIILLKNDRGILPLRKDGIRSIAVIGPNAAVARAGGGGSSLVEPPYAVSPLEGITASCGGRVAVRFSRGCLLTSELLPIASEHLFTAAGDAGRHGLLGEYFASRDLSGSSVVTRVDGQVRFAWGGGSPAAGIPEDNFSVRWTGKLVPPVSGTYKLGARSDDGVRVYLDGKLLVDDWTDHGPQVHAGEVALESNRAYDIRIEYYEAGGDATAELGWMPPTDSVQAAARVAATSDVAIVFVGLSDREEGEGVDRTTMEMPGDQARLIEAVARANSNTIVVLINGSPVSMEGWVGKVPAVVEAWYPGQEGGNAIADVLFGDVNPSGKLPTTLPKRLEDNPSYGNFPGKDNVVRYEEGIWVGYRHYDQRGIEPLFPFGHGLSYTSFECADLKIQTTGGLVDVTFEVKNTGDREGQEVAQLYVHDVESSLERPPKELKGFAKVRLKPGESKRVTLRLGNDAFSFYDPARKAWTAEPGKFEVLIGSSSRDIRLSGSYELSAGMGGPIPLRRIP